MTLKILESVYFVSEERNAAYQRRLLNNLLENENTNPLPNLSIYRRLSHRKLPGYDNDTQHSHEPQECINHPIRIS